MVRDLGSVVLRRIRHRLCQLERPKMFPDRRAEDRPPGPSCTNCKEPRRGARGVVGSTISLSKQLGLSVLAEGIAEPPIADLPGEHGVARRPLIFFRLALAGGGIRT